MNRIIRQSKNLKCRAETGGGLGTSREYCLQEYAPREYSQRCGLGAKSQQPSSELKGAKLALAALAVLFAADAKRGYWTGGQSCKADRLLAVFTLVDSSFIETLNCGGDLSKEELLAILEPKLRGVQPLLYGFIERVAADSLAVTVARELNGLSGTIEHSIAVSRQRGAYLFKLCGAQHFQEPKV